MRILAWARTSAGFCIASPATLSYGDEQGWEHVGWHEIERGGWNAELQKLTWVQYAVPGEVSRARLIGVDRSRSLSRVISGTHSGNHCRREVRPAGW